MKKKFWLSFSISVGWCIVSYFIAKPWIQDLATLTNSFIAHSIVFGVAIIPGFMNTFLVLSLLQDKNENNHSSPCEDVTLLISAYNEQQGIYDTLKYVKKQSYKGRIHTVVIDNNSNDNTQKEVLRAIEELDMDILLLEEKTPGKFNALNHGLKFVKTKYVITLDADTVIQKNAINNLMSKRLQYGNEVCAVAGSMLVRNAKDNWLAKIQEWDYFLAIASVKRMQGMYNSTLVAQGAFSLYDTEVVTRLGGWSDAIGEDIVLTWKMLALGYEVVFEPYAVAFTDVPTKFSHFCKQRSRWARGMIEGLRDVMPWQQKTVYSKFLTGIDLIIPFIDFSYTFFWIPGLVLALCFGNYAIVGPMGLLVLPLTLLSFGILYNYQKNKVFESLDLVVWKNKIGFLLFILTYQMIMSPVSLMGYVQELIGAKRVWK